jgi:hypothetical protein
VQAPAALLVHVEPHLLLASSILPARTPLFHARRLVALPGEQRRAEQRAAVMARQAELSASVREAAERRAAMEQERLTQLADKQRRKQALQVRGPSQARDLSARTARAPERACLHAGAGHCVQALV